MVAAACSAKPGALSLSLLRLHELEEGMLFTSVTAASIKRNPNYLGAMVTATEHTGWRGSRNDKEKGDSFIISFRRRDLTGINTNHPVSYVRLESGGGGNLLRNA